MKSLSALFFTPFTLFMLALLSACTSAPSGQTRIDTSIAAKSQESRVRFLIIHYTDLDQPTSLKVLSQRDVSSHYLVGNDDPVTLWRLVDEERMAWHAGNSSWKDFTQLNASSIGIEIVNTGLRDTPAGRSYTPFPRSQMQALTGLIREVVARHRIKPEFILGHAEIAPQRKTDPGPLFPWKMLAEAGLIGWPDAQQVRLQQARFEQQLPDAAWLQKKLARIGYAVPQSGLLDKETRNVMTVFQMRYRPARFDGVLDAESAAMLEVISAASK
jgi:N-acetylmuramoyl-L-alanine amidase